MKNLNKILIGGLVLIGSFMLSGKVEAAEYKYPVYPNSPEWEASTQDRGNLKAMLQIPENTLKELSTEELVNAVLEYPCFNDMYYYDSKQEGFEAMKSSFNGINELFQRKDADSILLEKYEETQKELKDISSDTKEFSQENYELICRKSNIEVLLAQEEVKENMTNEKRNKLDNLIATYKLTEEKSADQLTYKQNTYFKITEEQMTNNIETRASVNTPKGTPVYVFSRGEQISSTDKYYMRLEVERDFPGTIIVGDGTTCYNCHSFAWYWMDVNNKYWMNDPSAYMTDGSYKEVSLNGRKMNDRIWFSKVHSAVETAPGDKNDMLSKWGDYPLVRHSLTNNPYYTAPLIIKAYRR